MQFVPAYILENPDAHFLVQWDAAPNLKGYDRSAIMVFNQLCSSGDTGSLERRKYFLLHDYGQLHRKLGEVETELWEALATQKTDRSIEGKIRVEKIRRSCGARRKKLMADWEFVVSLLILICQHLRSVRAGDANPIKDEVSETL